MTSGSILLPRVPVKRLIRYLAILTSVHLRSHLSSPPRGTFSTLLYASLRFSLPSEREDRILSTDYLSSIAEGVIQIQSPRSTLSGRRNTPINRLSMKRIQISRPYLHLHTSLPSPDLLQHVTKIPAHRPDGQGRQS